MSENIAGDFYNSVLTAKNAGVELNKFYSTLFEIGFQEKNINVFNKLVKIFGRDIVFFSLLDMSDMDNEKINHNNIYPLISFFCKKRFESRNDSKVFSDLSVSIADRKKKLSKVHYGKDADKILDATD